MISQTRTNQSVPSILSRPTFTNQSVPSIVSRPTFTNQSVHSILGRPTFWTQQPSNTICCRIVLAFSIDKRLPISITIFSLLKNVCHENVYVFSCDRQTFLNQSYVLSALSPIGISKYSYPPWHTCQILIFRISSLHRQRSCMAHRRNAFAAGPYY